METAQCTTGSAAESEGTSCTCSQTGEDCDHFFCTPETKNTPTLSGFHTYKYFPNLPLSELILCSVAYCGGAIYSLFTFYVVSQKYKHHLPLGWDAGLPLGKKDDVDSEWFIFSSLLCRYFPWLVLHLCCSSLLKWCSSQYLCAFHLIYGIAVSIHVLSGFGTLVCFSVPVFMILILQTRSKHAIWLSWCLSLVLLNSHTFWTYLVHHLDHIEDGDYTASVILAWIILRTLSFCLDTCESDAGRTIPWGELAMSCLAYCFYFPLVIVGPFISYADYKKGVSRGFCPFTYQRIKWFCWSLLKLFTVMMAVELTTHYFYGHAFQHYLDGVKSMSSWSIAGMSYYNILFFYGKYYFFYGLGSLFAEAEGFTVPGPPRCVLLEYCFTDVWRHFDVGFYNFMVKYIYIPWIGDDPGVWQRLQASTVVFTFIYVWHGVSPNVFWWTVLNFGGVAVEKIGQLVGASEAYLQFEATWLPGAWSRRAKGILFTVPFFVGLVSLQNFLVSKEVAFITWRKLFIDGFPDVALVLFLFLYCIVQVGMEAANWRLQRKQCSKWE